MTLEMLAGAAIFLTGMMTGRWWPARRRKHRPPKPVCGCGHNRSFHVNGTGPCRRTTLEATGYDKYDNPVYKDFECGCQHYTGPEPLPEYYAPEIA
jgi:hypothetical protein